MMKKENSSDSHSGTVYEGLCVDLLNELRGKLQFDYELQLREEFGERKPEWNDRGTNNEGKLCLSVKTLWNSHYTMLVPPTEWTVF